MKTAHAISLCLLIAAPYAGAQNAKKLNRIENVAAFETQLDTGLFSAEDVATAKSNGQILYAANATALGKKSPLIIHSNPLESEKIQQIEEDLTIMDRLLSDAIGDSKSLSTAWASGIALANLSQTKQRPNMFITDVGAIFFLSVDYPLAGPEPETKPKEVAPKDTAWERARKRVYGRRTGLIANNWSPSQAANRLMGAVQYDAGRVERLVERLAEDLASAANIRGLSQGDKVWIVVDGPPAVKASQSSRDHTLRAYPLANGQLLSVTESPEKGSFIYSYAPSAKETRLTLSASKEDIDNLHDGTISLTEFKRTMQWTVR